VSAARGRVLQVAALSARYGHVEALRRVDLFVGEGELVAVLGPNGAGKSTLMRALMGLVATEGSVCFRGKDVPRRKPADAAAMGLVLVPEGRGIFAPMSVAENLELGAYLLNDKAEFARRYDRVLSLFPRLKERLTQTAGSLSGGEQQMLAVGRAIMSRPRLMLLDEASLGLAPSTAKNVYDAIRHLRLEFGIAMVVVEQNANLAFTLVDSATVLETGRNVLTGTSAELKGMDEIRRAYLGG